MLRRDGLLSHAYMLLSYCPGFLGVYRASLKQHVTAVYCSYKLAPLCLRCYRGSVGPPSVGGGRVSDTLLRQLALLRGHPKDIIYISTLS